MLPPVESSTWHLRYDEDDPIREVKKQVIANARLACRRLHNIASRYFLQVIGVRLDNWSSLERIQAISRNPSVAGGVLGVEVNLSYRPGHVANDMDIFSLLRAVHKKPFPAYRAKVQGSVDSG